MELTQSGKTKLHADASFSIIATFKSCICFTSIANAPPFRPSHRLHRELALEPQYDHWALTTHANQLQSLHFQTPAMHLADSGKVAFSAQSLLVFINQIHVLMSLPLQGMSFSPVPRIKAWKVPQTHPSLIKLSKSALAIYPQASHCCLFVTTIVVQRSPDLHHCIHRIH